MKQLPHKERFIIHAIGQVPKENLLWRKFLSTFAADTLAGDTIGATHLTAVMVIQLR